MEEGDIVHLTKRSIQGVVALISRQFILQLVSLGAFLVISTHLSASEFGTYIIVMALQQIISFFTDFGLGAALIQKKGEVEQEELTTIFTIQLIITGVILIAVFLFRDTVRNLVEVFASANLSEAGVWLLVSLTFTLFLSSFKLVPSILLERKINFQKLVIPQIVESLSFNLILVILMIKGFGISSYTYAFAVSGLLGVPVYYFVSPWKIELGITKNALSHLKFGTQFQAKNILANIKDRFLTLFLGATLGDTKVGYIGFGEKWAFFVFRFVVDSVTKVTFSTYSRMQDNVEHLGKAIEKSLFFVSAAMFPVSAGLILTAAYFVEYITKWNNKWEPAVISLIFLSLNASVSALSGILVNVLDATGRVKNTLQLMVIWTALIWILTPIMIKLYDYNGVAVASFLVTLTIVYTVHLVKQKIEFHFFRSIYKPLFATLGMGVFVYVATQLIVSNLITLLFVILMAGAVYAFLLFILAKKELTQDIKLLLRKHE